MGQSHQNLVELRYENWTKIQNSSASRSAHIREDSNPEVYSVARTQREGVQLIEKQKVRFTYGLGERQFRLYVNKALASDNPIQKLYELLESRLDNVIYRAGFAKTRAQARQITSHGLILVSGRRVTVPSIILKSGDKLSIRPGSTSSTLWTLADERVKEATIPAWLKVVASERVIEVIGRPVYEPSENLFNLGVVIEFYNR
jgi:small subunit ribosomal protein S4